MEIIETLFEGHQAIRLDTSMWKATILPGIGGKMISLIAQQTGQEWLWREPNRPLRLPGYGAHFEDFDISGFDECFPGIGEGPYPEAPWQGEIIPDHGELWTRQWSYEKSAGALKMRIDGVRFPYTFERSISAADDGSLTFSYQVNNTASAVLKYIWAAHPLFAAQPGTRILLPELSGIVLDFSKDDRQGTLLAPHSWPTTQDAHGETVDLSAVVGPEQKTADKIYALGLRDGWCALHHPASGAYLSMAFDIAQIPYLGIWINQGGWPFNAPPSFNVALEPCSGYPDRLDIAVERGAVGSIPAMGSAAWSFRLYGGSVSAADRIPGRGR